jgi:hypothetical protein
MKNVLIIILSEVRASNLTFDLFENNFLKITNADVALCIGKNENSEKISKFHDVAKYIWEINEPETCEKLYEEVVKQNNYNEEWKDILKNIINNTYSIDLDIVFGKLFEKKNNKGATSFLYYYRWLLLQKLKENNLINKYNWFIITRSDFMWNIQHPDCKFLDKNYIYIPDGENYTGINDRHIIIPKKYIEKSLEILDFILKNPQDIYEKCIINKTIINIETLLKYFFSTTNLINNIRRYPYTMYTVREKNGPSNWSFGKYNRQLKFNIKYKTEYKSYLSYSNTIKSQQCWKEILYKPTFLYLIQAADILPKKYDYLRNKDFILLSYKENTIDTKIFFPNSTWTTGRNKLREYVLENNLLYDYYILLDEDVEFINHSQKDGFENFEKLLKIYSPDIANPNYFDYPYKNNSNVVKTIWYDGIYNAFSYDIFTKNIIFPYIDKFDCDSWWISQYIMIIICSFYNIDVFVFNDLQISNINHSNYPKGDLIFKEVELYVFNTILNTKIINWDHNKKCIIITTINNPTKQIKYYSQLEDWDLIIIGDSKTNNEAYKEIKCIYLGLEQQKELFPSFFDKIPLNSYTRKMFGYLYAMKNCYNIIYDTDDDNKYLYDLNGYDNILNYKNEDSIDYLGNDIGCIKLNNYNIQTINNIMKENNAIAYTFDKRNNRLYIKNNNSNRNNHPFTISGTLKNTISIKNNGFTNIYRYYSEENIWPRGIPPNDKSINQIPEVSNNILNLKYSIIQGLVNNDPDVDAYYRININSNSFYFDKNLNTDILLNKYTICPFNSQNTFWIDSSMFYAMYLPVTVTFRYTDILRSYIALFQLWKNDKTIKFTPPTAIQERNEHDLNKDYESEISMYETANNVINLLNENKNADIIDFYEILAKNNIVSYEELPVIKEWIELVNSFTSKNYE